VIGSYEDRMAWRKEFIKKTLPDIVSELLAVDKKEWHIIDKHHDGEPLTNPYIVSADAERAWLSIDEYDKKLTLHGAYGEHADGRMWIARDSMPRSEQITDPRPTISLTKAPYQIAKDIARRFLPDYRKIRAVYLAQLAEQQEYRRQSDSTFEDLVKASKGALLPREAKKGDSERAARFTDVKGIHYSNDVRVSGDYVRFELSVTPALAKRIIAAIAEAK
jgi:hypothetical protein